MSHFDKTWQEASTERFYQASKEMDFLAYDWIAMFYFSSASGKPPLMKLDMEEVLNVIHHVCIFSVWSVR